MKLSNYLFSAIVLLVAVLITCEAEMYRYDYIEGQNFTAIYVDSNDAKNDFLEQAVLLSQKYDVGLLIKDSYCENEYSENVDYYTLGNAEEKIRALGVKPFTANSLYAGKVVWTFKALDESYKDINYFFSIYVTGGNDVQAFMSAMRENFPNMKTDAPSPKTYNLTVFFLWFAAAIILFIIFRFDTLTVKKTAAIKMTLGSGARELILKRLCVNIVTFAFICFLIIGVCYIFTPLILTLRYIPIIYISVLFISLLSDLALYKINIPETIKGEKNGRTLQTQSAIVKALLVCAAGICIVSIADIYSANRSGFSDLEIIDKYFSDYSYADFVNSQNLTPELLSQIDPFELRTEVYKEHFDDWKPLILKGIAQENSAYSLPCVDANIYALPYLQSEINEAKDISTGKGVTALLPKSVSQNDLTLLINRFETRELDYNICYYDDNNRVEILCFGEDPSVRPTTTQRYNNPIIIIDTADKAEDIYYSTVTMWKATEDMLSNCADELSLNQGRLEASSVKDVYNYRFGIIIAKLVFAVVMLILAVIMSITVVLFYFSMYFSLNAKELCLKKTLGYTMVERYSKVLYVLLKIFVFAGLVFLLCLANGIITTGQLLLVALTVIFIAIADIFALIYKIKRLENQAVQKILKGGAL